jgi:hypothetical protein
VSRWQTLRERFDEKYVVDENGCWIWTGYVAKDGYGRITVDDRPKLAHRIGYALLVGGLDDQLTLDHLCRVRHCVNPAHLEQVTRGENVLRGVGISAVNKAKTHCWRGHEFTPDNTYVLRGKRWCRKCNRIRRRQTYERSLAA